jgi:hypothetical protein
MKMESTESFQIGGSGGFSLANQTPFMRIFKQKSTIFQNLLINIV